MSCKDRALIDGHFEGTIRPAEERVMREHLVTCEPCRAYYRRRLLLAKLDPEAPKAEARIARGLGLGAPEGARRASRRAIVPIVAATLSLAAALLLFVRAPTGDEGFTPRGALEGSALSTSDGPSIGVFRFPKDSAGPMLVAGADAPIAADDELGFSYQNPDRSHLMIFGVDESQRVYWFHPAWTNPTDNPSAIPIARGGGVHELREAIRHPLAGRRLEVHGLFLDRALTVREVEALVAARSAPRTPIVVDGGVDQIVELEVTR